MTDLLKVAQDVLNELLRGTRNCLGRGMRTHCSISPAQLLQKFKSGEEAGVDLLLVDLRRTDHEVNQHALRLSISQNPSWWRNILTDSRVGQFVVH